MDRGPAGRCFAMAAERREMLRAQPVRDAERHWVWKSVTWEEGKGRNDPHKIANEQRQEGICGCGRLLGFRYV